MMQLGLATGQDVDGLAPAVTSDTHFRPIGARRKKRAQQQEMGVGDLYKCHHRHYQQQKDEEEWGADDDEVVEESYQLYQGEETHSTDNVFVPSFRIHTTCEKSAQTGDDEEEEESVEPALDAIFGIEMRNELQLDAWDEQDMNNYEFFQQPAEVVEAAGGAIDDQQGLEYSSDYESMPPDMTLEELQVRHLAELWDDDVEGATVLVTTGDVSPGGEAATPTLTEGGPSYRSIWSCGDDAMPSLPQHTLSPAFMLREQAIHPRDLHKLHPNHPLIPQLYLPLENDDDDNVFNDDEPGTPQALTDDDDRHNSFPIWSSGCNAEYTEEEHVTRALHAEVLIMLVFLYSISVQNSIQTN